MENQTVDIYIMGRRYEVPAGLTIMKAMENAGYRFLRGCGCRGGICGACGTVYRTAGDYRLKVGLACQQVVEPEMYLSQIPFYPANRACYDLDKLAPSGETILSLYPEILKCMGCNACTQSCPQDLKTMQIMAAALSGDLEKAAVESFECIMCGLCVSRCPGQQVQPNVSILCRRLYGKYIQPRAEHVARRVREIREGKYDEEMTRLMKMDKEDLARLYEERDIEPD